MKSMSFLYFKSIFYVVNSEYAIRLKQAQMNIKNQSPNFAMLICPISNMRAFLFENLLRSCYF